MSLGDKIVNIDSSKPEIVEHWLSLPGSWGSWHLQFGLASIRVPLCPLCGSVVPEEYKPVHIRWHRVTADNFDVLASAPGDDDD